MSTDFVYIILGEIGSLVVQQKPDVFDLKAWILESIPLTQVLTDSSELPEIPEIIRLIRYLQ